MIKIKKILCGIMISFASFCVAKAPYEPEFSLSVIEGLEPPPLPQVYGIDVPNTWESYENKLEPKKSLFLPHTPMVMEVCAITGQTQYFYRDARELLDGCYRRDLGLSLLELQPYEYWATLSRISGERLMPRNFNAPFNVHVILNFKNAAISRESLMTIELGEFNSPLSYISINGQVYQHNLEVMRAIYGMIYQVKEERI